MYALTAPDLSLKDSSARRWFFVNLDVLLDEPDSDEVVFDRSKRELRGLDNTEVQYEQRMLPCTVLLTQQAFYQWRDGFEDWVRANASAEMDRYRVEWRDGWTKAVTDFQTFDVPLVELPRVDEADGDAIGRVCAIFEKLNSTGVDLSVYDLLTARLYRYDIRLHDLWDGAVATHSRLRAWSKGKADEHKFGVLVLRALALLRGLDPKPRILIDLQPENFEADWRRAAAAMERALELVELVGPDGFGVFAEKWLPGYGLVPILAALRAEIDDKKLGQVERDELRRWYWCNVFLERYSSAVESKSRKDYQEMTRHWFDDGPEPEIFREAQAWIGSPGFRVRDSASYASAVYSGIFCLLALRSARDWRRGEDIRLQELHDHHIFPQAYLRRHGINKRVDVNTIANRTLISNETNNKIKDNAPADYLADRQVFPDGPQPDLLAAHFVDENAAKLLAEAAEALPGEEAAQLYECFLQARQAALIGEIRRACGISASREPAIEQGPDDLAADVMAGTAPLFDLDGAAAEGSSLEPLPAIRQTSPGVPPFGAASSSSNES